MTNVLFDAGLPANKRTRHQGSLSGVVGVIPHGNSNVLHWQIGARLWWSLEVFACVQWSTEVLCGGSEKTLDTDEMVTPTLQRWEAGWALRCLAGPAQRCRSQNRRTRPGSKKRKVSTEKMLYMCLWKEQRIMFQENSPKAVMLNIQVCKCNIDQLLPFNSGFISYIRVLWTRKWWWGKGLQKNGLHCNETFEIRVVSTQQHFTNKLCFTCCSRRYLWQGRCWMFITFPQKPNFDGGKCENVKGLVGGDSVRDIF